MATRSRMSVGRVRVTRVVSPAEAGYIRAMRNQMKTIEQAITAKINQIQGATPAALKYATQPIFDKSQVYVPVDKGPLKASGFHTTERTAKGARVNIGYGKGGNPPYAVFVHERLDLAHDAPTRAKFLEQAANEHISQIVPRAARYLKKATGL